MMSMHRRMTPVDMPIAFEIGANLSDLLIPDTSFQRWVGRPNCREHTKTVPIRPTDDQDSSDEREEDGLEEDVVGPWCELLSCFACLPLSASDPS